MSKVNENAESVDDIIQALKGKIIHETSKVLEGRMIALTIDNKSLIEFQKQAEEISEKYQQALVEEGIPLNIAEKLIIDKTVDLCRKNTKSSEVKAILSATAHPTASSVISKMMTQIDAVRLDKLTTMNKKGNDKNKNGNNNNNRGQRGRGNGNKSGNNNDGNNNGSNGQNGQNGNGRGGGQNNRGRGRGSGYRGRGGHNGFGGGQQFYQTEQRAFPIQGNGQMPPQGAQPQSHYQHTQHTQ